MRARWFPQHNIMSGQCETAASVLLAFVETTHQLLEEKDTDEDDPFLLDERNRMDTLRYYDADSN